VGRIGMGAVDGGGDILLERPQQHLLVPGGGHLGQCRPPCAGAHDPDPHAFTPAPRARSAAGSSGQRGRAGTSSVSIMPALKRSIPAHPIIAALSVHSHKGGATKGRPCASATPCSAL